MPPKALNAPKPVAFSVVSLQAGKKKWEAGTSGPPVKVNYEGTPVRDVMAFMDPTGSFGQPKTWRPERPRREVLLLGKVLFGRQRFAFEVQELDYARASVQKLLDKEKELDRERFGDALFFGESDHEDQRGKDCADWLGVVKARDLAARHSLQVKFEDIRSIEATGDSLTLSLTKPPQCYVKPAGERGTVGNRTGEVCKDITNGAKTIVLTTAPSPSGDSLRGRDDKVLGVPEVRELLVQHCPRLAALLRGDPPPPAPVAATPRGKKREAADDPAESATKQRRPREERNCSLVPQPIAAGEGTWLKKAVDRFGLSGPLDASVSEEQWFRYLEERASLDEAAKSDKSEGHSDEDEDSKLFGEEEEEEEEPAADILARIRAAAKATMASTALALDPDVVARGVYLLDHESNDAGEGEPRTASAHARIYSPLGNGHVVHLFYLNHCRVRQSFTERNSYLCAFRGVVGSVVPPRDSEPRSKQSGWEKLFDLDYNEFRRKNQVKTSVATNATLAGLGAHLFGVEGAVSNRKVFGLLVRAAGLGQYKENNGWPLAVMRRRFKCGKGESETDTERVAGDRDEDPSMGSGCCVM
mmetsp:Transcript_27362/g.72270  ORF Transcript_27362/g.72270 Transcript_27362/m.72270 type:complete len:586 (-) Transcript_27362:29-1786(-)